MTGLIPMTKVIVELGVVQVLTRGLQTPRVTVPPAAKGRYGSGFVGTVMVSWMVVELETTPTTLGSETISPLLTIPTTVGEPLTTNPVPLRATGKLPPMAVGRLAGKRLVITGPGDLTFTVSVTTIPVPPCGVMVTVPVRA